MLCQICGKNQANIHLEQVINGKKAEISLCDDCAQKLGASSILDDVFDPKLDDFFGDIFPEFSTVSYKKENVSVTKCKKCGTTFSDIAASGRVGCANCYSTFSEELFPYIVRIHGNTKHVGKVAACCGENGTGAILNREDEVGILKKKLEEAVKKQEFEQAAVIRDKIKDLIKGGDLSE